MIETVRLGAKRRREVPDKQLEQARSTPNRSAAGNTARLLAQSAVFELAAGSGVSARVAEGSLLGPHHGLREHARA
jgi:hypothetical protein